MVLRMRLRPRLLTAVLVPLAVLTAGCGSSSTTATTATTATPATTATTGSPSTTGSASGTITVLAAASLTESFTALGKQFEAAHPGSKVTLSFGASSTLVTQILQGAPADVFASADTANMKKLTDASQAAGDPKAFATNRLEIIVQKGNPKNITGVADLAKPGVTVVTCGPDVPIGKYSAQVFAKAGVTVTPKSYEADVKAVVQKVVLGEADAGIVYATDVQAAGDKATGVVIPDAQNVIATYPIAVTKTAPNAALATAFVAYVSGADGLATLAKFGFTAP